jgi:glycosyltransferase involved in cell wall biosynthesis
MSGGNRALSIAILGTRGVPARYGGFETMSAELGSRLVARGHRVTVYCRRGMYPDVSGDWNGIERIELPAIRSKYLETVSHTFLSTIDALRRDFDVVLLCNAANAFSLPLLRASRVPVAVNVDGIERKRKKWNALGRLVYLAGESLAAGLANTIVADAEVIADYYRTHLGTGSDVIAYGAEFPDEADTDILDRLDVRRRGYVLYVSRFEPENHPLEVAESWRKVKEDLPLVMVGGAPYARGLTNRVRAVAARDGRIRLPGMIFGADYRTLQRNSLLYVQATEVGGTHPALIEAMASGGAVLANDTAENREVGGDAVMYFRLGDRETLSSALQQALADGSGLDEWRVRARSRAGARYSWDAVTNAYERLFGRLVSG